MMDARAVSTVDKVLDILALLSHERTQISIEEIKHELNLSQSTAYRYVRILVDRGFLDRTDTGSYRLGATLIALSQAALHTDRNVRLAALPSMKRIAEETRESVSLMRRVNKRAVCIESLEGQYALRVTIEPGRTQRLHAGASSKVLLAFSDAKHWENLLEFPLLAFTNNTLTDLNALREHLLEIRQAGYAVSDGEIDIGARAIAVPILNRHSEIVAALSIEAPQSRMDNSVLQHYIALLHDHAQTIRSALN